MSRALLLGTAGVVLLVCALALWLGRLEWFFRDDFVFLARMQDPDGWTWTEVFLPLEQRPWIFYRPLSMELFFYAGYELFGLDALPYYCFSLALDFATAPFVYCIAIQLGFERRAALVGALLAVTRAPTLTEVYYASCFMYVAVLFFGLASAAAFLRYLRAGGARWQLLSCVALVLAFGCNEVSVLLPALFALLGLGSGLVGAPGGIYEPALLRRLGMALAPQALLTALFIFFRFVLVGPVDSDFWNQLVATSIYRHQLGPHVLPNVVWLLEQTAGGALPLAGVGLLLVGAWLALASRARGREQLRWLVGVGAVFSAWILLLLPVFALLPQREARWAMMLAFPLSLLVAAHASALLRAYGSGRRGLADAALLGLLLLAVPVAPMLARAADPVGGPPRRFVAWAALQRPRLAPDAILVALYGGPGLASEAEAIRLRASTSWGRSLAVAEPGSRPSLRFHDVSQRPARGVVRPDSVYVRLLPGLRFEPASAAWLERELPRHSPVLSSARGLR